MRVSDHGKLQGIFEDFMFRGEGIETGKEGQYGVCMSATSVHQIHSALSDCDKKHDAVRTFCVKSRDPLFIGIQSEELVYQNLYINDQKGDSIQLQVLICK